MHENAYSRPFMEVYWEYGLIFYVNGVILKVLAFIVVFIVSSKAEVCGLEQYISEVYCSALTTFCSRCLVF